MSMVNFFAAVAENFKLHYESLSRSLDRNQTPGYYRSQPAVNDTAVSTPVQPAEDTVEISPEARQSVQKPHSPEEPESSSPTPPVDAEKESAEEAPVTQNPQSETENPAPADGTYNFERRARLDYAMNLRFDLGTFTRSIEKLAEGDTQSVEEIVAGGFGLSADLRFSGKAITRTEGEATESDGTDQASRTKSVARGRQSSVYRAESDDFAVDAFTKEAYSVRRSTNNVIDRAGHQLAVSRFSMRYSLDSSFSFANLNRFNVQTKQVADQMPEAVNQYVDSAGQVAESGSTEMMAAFFDTVDSYLGSAEERLIENAQAFLDAAAKELGFSEETMAMAEDHLIGSIESFFDRVDAAVSQLAAKYVPEVTPAPAQPTELNLPPQDLYDPAIAQERQTVAVA